MPAANFTADRAEITFNEEYILTGYKVMINMLFAPQLIGYRFVMACKHPPPEYSLNLLEHVGGMNPFSASHRGLIRGCIKEKHMNKPTVLWPLFGKK